MKGVILAGGTGSRLKPFTRFMNKHLLPVGHLPMIYWPIITLRDAGVKDILIVTNKKHLASFIDLLGDGDELKVQLHYKVQQQEGGGIADALKSAQKFIGKEKFVMLLGDNVISDSIAPYVKLFQEQEKGARVLLKEVPDPTRYGVPELDEANRKIKSIVEKPIAPPSTYCVTGIYMYDQEVFTLLGSIHPSKRNELEITDVNNLYIKNDLLEYDIISGWWIDAGTHKSLYQASSYIFENLGEGE